MYKTVRLFFPDDWKKGKCDICPFRKELYDECRMIYSCALGLQKSGGCALEVKPYNREEKDYNCGYKDGFKEGYMTANSVM